MIVNVPRRHSERAPALGSERHAPPVKPVLIHQQEGCHQPTPDQSRGSRALTIKWALGAVPTELTGQKHRTSQSRGKEEELTALSTKTRNHPPFVFIVSMVPEAPEWGASLSCLRQLSTIQVPLHGHADILLR